jgi:hypothetical protein
MGAYDLKQAFHQLPGVERLTIEHRGNGNQVISIGDRTIEVGPMATNEDIERALANPWAAKRQTMSITGLKSGAFEAKLAEMKRKLSETQNQGLAKIDGAEQAASAKIDAATSGAAAKIDKEVEDALAEFAAFTNGGPE